MFIRKRDPRYIKETLDEAKLQATLLAASQSQAAKAKAEFQENLRSFQTQEWMEAEPTPAIDEDEEDEESEVEEEFECVACKKTYKNERYYPDTCPEEVASVKVVCGRFEFDFLPFLKSFN